MAYEKTCDNALSCSAELQTLYSQYEYLENKTSRSKSPERRGVHWSAKLVEVLYFDPNSKDMNIEESKQRKLTYTLYDVASRYFKDDNAVRKGLEFVNKEINCRNAEVLHKNYAIQEQVEEWV